MAAITLTVNGHRHQVAAEADTPLLYVLRNDLELNGPRFGCGLGQCGSCTVLVDGQPARSCITEIGALSPTQISAMLPSQIAGFTSTQTDAMTAAQIAAVQAARA